jgi:hypothetical protein
MIISKFGKSYDTSNGSEQHHAPPPQRGAGIQPVAQADARGARIATADALAQTHEKVGGELQPPISPLELSVKPAWSVLSLADLNQAIRLGDWPDNPAILRRAHEDAERKMLQADEVKAKQIASRARAHRDRYRNHWENT